MKQLSVIGNLTADCKQTQNGAIWFSMAIDNGKTQDGKKISPLYVQVCGAPKQLEPYLKKGLKVFVSGQTNIKISYFTDQSGVAIPQLDVVIYSPMVQLIQGAKSDNAQ